MIHCSNLCLFCYFKRKTPFQFKIRVMSCRDCLLPIGIKNKQITPFFTKFAFQAIQTYDIFHSIHFFAGVISYLQGQVHIHTCIFAIKSLIITRTMLKYFLMTIWFSICQEQFAAYIRKRVSFNTRKLTYSFIRRMHIYQSQINCPRNVILILHKNNRWSCFVIALRIFKIPNCGLSNSKINLYLNFSQNLL